MKLTPVFVSSFAALDAKGEEVVKKEAHKDEISLPWSKKDKDKVRAVFVHIIVDKCFLGLKIKIC